MYIYTYNGCTSSSWNQCCICLTPCVPECTLKFNNPTVARIGDQLGTRRKVTSGSHMTPVVLLCFQAAKRRTCKWLVRLLPNIFSAFAISDPLGALRTPDLKACLLGEARRLHFLLCCFPECSSGVATRPQLACHFYRRVAREPGTVECPVLAVYPPENEDAAQTTMMPQNWVGARLKF